MESFFHVHFTEVFPPEILLFRTKNRFHRSTKPTGPSFIAGFDLIQITDEDQVSQLFDDGDRIGHSACPESIPDLIDLGFQRACYHMVSFLFTCERIKIRLFVRCGRGHRSLSDARGRGRLFFKISKLYFRSEVSLYNTEGAEMGYLSFQNKLLIQYRGHRDGAEAPESSIELFLAMIYVVQDKSDYET